MHDGEHDGGKLGTVASRTRRSDGEQCVSREGDWDHNGEHGADHVGERGGGGDGGLETRRRDVAARARQRLDVTETEAARESEPAAEAKESVACAGGLQDLMRPRGCHDDCPDGDEGKRDDHDRDGGENQALWDDGR